MGMTSRQINALPPGTVRQIQREKSRQLAAGNDAPALAKSIHGPVTTWYAVGDRSTRILPVKVVKVWEHRLTIIQEPNGAQEDVQIIAPGCSYYATREQAVAAIKRRLYQAQKDAAQELIDFQAAEARHAEQATAKNQNTK